MREKYLLDFLRALEVKAERSLRSNGLASAVLRVHLNLNATDQRYHRRKYITH
jgi:hypothetical protein